MAMYMESGEIPMMETQKEFLRSAAVKEDMPDAWMGCKQRGNICGHGFGNGAVQTAFSDAGSGTVPQRNAVVH